MQVSYKKENIFNNSLALVVGGSKGMGFATAKELVLKGSNVCLVARGKESLDLAARELRELLLPGRFADTICCDATQPESLKPLIEKFIQKRDVPDFVINAAGYAYPQYIQELTFSDFKKNMDTNYYVQLVPILIILPWFLRRHQGHFINFSSVLGYMGLMGYATYTPTKYAILGLSETLRHELKSYNIKVSVVFPPDTNTPGFEQENLTKPPETKLLSGNAKLLQPEEVAKVVIKGIQKNKFTIFPGNSGMLYHINRIFPNIVRFFLDHDLKKYRKQTQTSEKP